MPVVKKVSFEDEENENFYIRGQLVELLDCFKREDTYISINIYSSKLLEQINPLYQLSTQLVKGV